MRETVTSSSLNEGCGLEFGPELYNNRGGRREGIQIKLELKFIILISSNLDTEPTKERQSRNFLLVLGNYAHGQDFSDIVPALSTL